MDEPWRDLAEFRRKASLSQSDFGYPVCSQSQVSLIEQGVMMPNVTALHHFARRLGEDIGKWTERWTPHKLRVKAQTRLWRSFVRRDWALLQGQLDDTADESLELDKTCYQLWTNLQGIPKQSMVEGERFIPVDNLLTAEIQAGASRDVATLQARVQHAKSPYLPCHMRGQGDLRLRVVLAMIEATYSRRFQRHRSAIVWQLEAHRLFCQVPRYWM